MPGPSGFAVGQTTEETRAANQRATEIGEFQMLASTVTEAEDKNAFKSTVEYCALRSFPQPGHLNQFEQSSFRERQQFLMRLHKLQSTVNLKPLPIALALLSGLLAMAAVMIRWMGDPLLAGGTLLGAFVFLLILSILMLLKIREYRQLDAYLTVWTEAFKDSHARQTKIEEEERKAQRDAAEAETLVVDGKSQSDRYRWAEKIFG